MPTADNCLAIKRTSLEEWEKKITKKHEALKALTQQHNEKYNTTGQTFRINDGAPVKPAPPGAGSTQGEPEDWPAEQTYDSMEAVKDGSFQTMSGSYWPPWQRCPLPTAPQYSVERGPLSIVRQ